MEFVRLPPPQHLHRQDVTTSWLDGENLQPAAFFLQQSRCQDPRQDSAIMRDSQFAKNNKARAWHGIHDTCAQIMDERRSRGWNPWLQG